jgi:hypothetical protein
MVHQILMLQWASYYLSTEVLQYLFEKTFEVLAVTFVCLSQKSRLWQGLTH